MVIVSSPMRFAEFVASPQAQQIPGIEKPATFFRHGQNFLPFELKRYVIASQQIRLYSLTLSIFS
jgi:hypothetical protein